MAALNDDQEVIPRLMTFVSPLHPDECLRRLEAHTVRDIPIVSDLGMSRRVLLRRRGARIWLRYRRPWLTNSLAPIYAAVVHPHDRGTRIVGVFRLHRLVVIFMVVWLAIVTASTGTLFVVGLRDLLGGEPRAVNGDPWMFVLIGPGLFGMAGIVWLFGRWLGKKDEREITSFVKQVLDAEEISTSSGDVAVHR